MPQSSDIIAAARRHIGTRWRHQGRTPGIALDCVGLVIKVAHELNVTDFDHTAYDRRSDFRTFISLFRAHATERPKTELLPGRIVIIPTGGTAHCGILGDRDGLSLIHGYALSRRVTEEPWSPFWASCLVAVFSFPGVDD